VRENGNSCPFLFNTRRLSCSSATQFNRSVPARSPPQTADNTPPRNRSSSASCTRSKAAARVNHFLGAITWIPGHRETGLSFDAETCVLAVAGLGCLGMSWESLGTSWELWGLKFEKRRGWRGNATPRCSVGVPNGLASARVRVNPGGSGGSGA
jgi:hypothetical protein